MNCEYCCTDRDGYVKPLDKNGHAYLSKSMFSKKMMLYIRINGASRSYSINFCPMCGRSLMEMEHE